MLALSSRRARTVPRGRGMPLGSSTAKGIHFGMRHSLMKATVSADTRLLWPFYHPGRLYSTDPTQEHMRPAKTAFADRKMIVYSVLRGGQPEQILHAMANVRNRKVVASMPDSVFISAFLRLTPEHFLKPFMEVLQPLGEDRLMKIRELNSVHYTLLKFFVSVNDILRARLGRGGGEERTANSFGLVEYKHLLRISASVGDLQAVIRVWEAMKYSEVKPDLQCYNWYLHACVWEGVVYGAERYRLHVSPTYYRARTLPNAPEPFRGFGTGPKSVRKQVNSIIVEMREANLPLDEDTFVYMLLANARVGSRSGMDNIMKLVWGVDVKAIENTPLEKLPAAKPLAASSPVYPSSKLLFAVAHAYGCNSMFEKAFRMIQFLSVQYGIEITDDVWGELFHTAFMLSRPRRKNDPKILGKINPQTLLGIKDMLRLDGKTYDDLNRYCMLVKTVRLNKDKGQFQKLIREAYDLLHKTRKERNDALGVLESYLGMSLHDYSANVFRIRRAFPTPHLWRALRKYELLRLLVEQQQMLMQRMIKYVFYKQKYLDEGHLEWSRRLLPRFLAEWRDFLPESYTIRLSTGDGEVTFYGRTTYRDTKIRVHDYDPVRWSACGGDFVVGEENGEKQVVDVCHDVLWAHFRARTAVYKIGQPFERFLRRGWGFEPILFRKTVSAKDDVDEEEEEQQKERQSTLNEWKLRNSKSRHIYYVTMEPLFTLAS